MLLLAAGGLLEAINPGARERQADDLRGLGGVAKGSRPARRDMMAAHSPVQINLQL